MPYKLVFTKNGPNDEVSAVPEGWVIGTYLYWPRSLKKSEIESLRSNENSIPDKSWKKIKCRLKLSDICSFEEALHLEDLYSKFQDTEDEEMYLNERQNKKKLQNVNALSKQLLDVNSEFDIDEHNITPNEISSEGVMVKPDKIITKNVANSDEVNVSSDNQDNIQVTLNDVQGTSTSNDDILTITTSELLKIVQENNSLQTENKALKEDLLRSVEFEKETKKNFAIMQTQLDKIIELLQNKNQANSSVNANNDLSISEDGIDKIIIGNVMFPIKTKEQLEELEYKLLEKDVMTYLVKKFSETCGTSGIAKISKIGLPLMKCLIKDELLHQFTWKGIKGSMKMAFVQYVKIRELFYKVVHLADKSCSFSDSDSFIQNSAIKHSGQRLKRHMLSSESKINVKKTKKEISIIEKDTSKIDKENLDYRGLNNNQESTDDKCRSLNEGDMDISNPEKLQAIVDDCRGLKNYTVSTGDNCRDVNGENINSSNIEKLQVIDNDYRGFKNNKESKDDNCRDVNDENVDSSNIEKLQGSSIKKEADDFTNTQNQPSCSKIVILSDVKIRNKAMDIKDVNKMANISSINVNSVLDDLIKFSP